MDTDELIVLAKSGTLSQERLVEVLWEIIKKLESELEDLWYTSKEWGEYHD